VHVFARPLPEDAPPDAAPARALEAELAERLGARRVETLAPGTLVLDVVVHPGEAPFAGLHRHGEGRSRAPGGTPEVQIPPLAPSRAYAKLREALELAGEAMRPGELAVELGSAPGGTTLAMLEQGTSVIGVDPGEMDPGVLAFTGPGGARVRHRKMPAGALAPAELPARIDWLVVDLNLAPPVALRYVARLLRARPPRRGALLTLKMNDAAALAAIPEHLAAVRAMGLPRVVARQLPANRSEITVIARPPSTVLR
jgi:23S rRNA (cytidine2498-2'-O)-methyltransferase